MKQLVCTWEDPSGCTDCDIRGRLACRWNLSSLLRFYLVSFPPVIVAVASMAIIGALFKIWWPLIAYAVYFPVMLGVFEPRFLCSHCPFYAERSGILHCLANHGLPKLWRYRPSPMNGLEKFMMVFLVIACIFVIFPLAAEAYGLWRLSAAPGEYGSAWLWAMAAMAFLTVVAGFIFLFILRHSFCSRCVNFSCPLNTVLKAVVDAYLVRNDIMRQAWEEAGYRLG